jgi:acyl-CoA reductase-like NAD-dependent aldehyde dehydrogenase
MDWMELVVAQATGGRLAPVARCGAAEADRAVAEAELAFPEWSARSAKERKAPLSYLFSRDAARIHRITRGLQAGIVGVNTGAVATEVAPFGGYKESGLGREGAREGIAEFMETKFICQAFA